MAQWLCVRCNTKFPTEYGYEHHNCPSDVMLGGRKVGVFDGIISRFSRRSSPMGAQPEAKITCGVCQNKMTAEQFSGHACVKDGRVDAKNEKKNVMKIALFVHSKRKDVRSMRLAATEFRGAQYLVRGVSSEEEFIKIAREMGSSIYIATSSKGGPKELSRDIMRRADVCFMFPSKDDTDKKDTYKLTIDIDGHKVPTVVYPEA